MAKKDFSKAPTTRVINEVAKASNQKANVLEIKLIKNENLLDYPANHEDCEDTSDLDNAIAELGFTDPIEVTSFGMEDGKYTIISGHRRRAAGVKAGIDTFPCIIQSFDSAKTMHNAVLLANSQRDSAKDPLLFCKRYKMHEEYLKSITFSGSFREEIAKRLGISVQHADRYKTFNKIILPVWDMVRNEIIGMSNVLPMASHPEDEQLEIYGILQMFLLNNETLTRTTCDKIIKGYRDGKRCYEDFQEIQPVEVVEESEMSDSNSDIDIFSNPENINSTHQSFINTEPSETKDPAERNRNNETRREYDPLSPLNEKDPLQEERLTEEDYETIELIAKNGSSDLDSEFVQDDESDSDKSSNNSSDATKKTLSTEEKKLVNGNNIHKHLTALEKCLNEFYEFETDEIAETSINAMSNLAKSMLDELDSLCTEYSKEDLLKSVALDISKLITPYL